MADQPMAFGVEIPPVDEVICVVCPKCKAHGAQADRVGSRLYGECRNCGWTEARTISRERMQSALSGGEIQGLRARLDKDRGRPAR
jgi:hypothetical protein